MNARNILDFTAGHYIQQHEYKSFRPESILQPWLCTQAEINDLLGQANRNLGALDAYSGLIPDVDYFIRMHVTKEATTSSKIEGTMTSFEEALTFEGNIDPEKRDDWQEVNNYILAINYAQEELSKIPISSRLLWQTHSLLLKGARGKNKMPGEFRKSQNWIGGTLKHAHFVPPHHSEIGELMSDLEYFIHSESQQPPILVPHMIKLAMIHYQFETIHPFLDGNGRIGRLLITLYLMEKNLLQYPTLYLSDYFERNRSEYYHQLTQVRERNTMDKWIIFFLRGVIETSENSIGTFRDIIHLRSHVELELSPQLGRSQENGLALITYMWKQPILEGKEIAKVMELHPSNANRLITKLVSLGILKELTGYQRNRLYGFRPYLDIFMK